VTAIERSPGAIRLSLYQTANPDAGSASLTFADDPLALKQWTIRDSRGTEVLIALQDAVFGVALPNDLFATPKTRRCSERRQGPVSLVPIIGPQRGVAGGRALPRTIPSPRRLLPRLCQTEGICCWGVIARRSRATST